MRLEEALFVVVVLAIAWDRDELLTSETFVQEASGALQSR